MAERRLLKLLRATMLNGGSLARYYPEYKLAEILLVERPYRSVREIKRRRYRDTLVINYYDYRVEAVEWRLFNNVEEFKVVEECCGGKHVIVRRIGGEVREFCTKHVARNNDVESLAKFDQLVRAAVPPMAQLNEGLDLLKVGASEKPIVVYGYFAPPLRALLELSVHRSGDIYATVNYNVCELRLEQSVRRVARVKRRGDEVALIKKLRPYEAAMLSVIGEIEVGGRYYPLFYDFDELYVDYNVERFNGVLEKLKELPRVKNVEYRGA